MENGDNSNAHSLPCGVGCVDSIRSSIVREEVWWAADALLGREWAGVTEWEDTASDALGVVVVETRGVLGASETRRERSSAVLHKLQVGSGGGRVRRKGWRWIFWLAWQRDGEWKDLMAGVER